jgi:hypothetical protein
MPATSRVLAYRRAAREAAVSAMASAAAANPVVPFAQGAPEVKEVADETPAEILAARESFEAFCTRMGKPPPRHMREWYEVFLTGQSNEHLSHIAGPDTALLSPRGSAKSTFVAMLLAWLIGKHALEHKLLRVLYVSYNVKVAKAKSAAVKSIINSDDYRLIFPNVRLSRQKKGDELWEIDFTFAGIDVRGEDAFTLACAGLRGAITSKRASLIVVDDLIKSQSDIANPDVRREMEHNWSAVIEPTRFEGGRSLVLGTRFHFDDMFATAFVPKNGWKATGRGCGVSSICWASRPRTTSPSRISTSTNRCQPPSWGSTRACSAWSSSPRSTTRSESGSTCRPGLPNGTTGPCSRWPAAWGMPVT